MPPDLASHDDPARDIGAGLDRAVQRDQHRRRENVRHHPDQQHAAPQTGDHAEGGSEEAEDGQADKSPGRNARNAAEKVDHAGRVQVRTKRATLSRIRPHGQGEGREITRHRPSRPRLSTRRPTIATPGQARGVKNDSDSIFTEDAKNDSDTIFARDRRPHNRHPGLEPGAIAPPRASLPWAPGQARGGGRGERETPYRLHVMPGRDPGISCHQRTRRVQLRRHPGLEPGSMSDPPEAAGWTPGRARGDRRELVSPCAAPSRCPGRARA